MSELPPFEWRARPWRRAARLPLVLAAAAVVLVLASAIAQGSGLAAALSLAAGAYVLSPLFVPVGYRVDAEGVRRRSPFAERRYRWEEFAGYRVDPAGRAVYLRRPVRGWGRLRGALALFLPDERVAREVTRRLDAWLPRRPGRP